MAKGKRSRPQPYEQDDTYVGRPAKSRTRAVTSHQDTATEDGSPPSSPARAIATSRTQRNVFIQGIWDPSTPMAQFVKDLIEWNDIAPGFAVLDRIIRFTSSAHRESWRGQYTDREIDLCCTAKEAARGFFQSRPKALVKLAIDINDLSTGAPYRFDMVHIYVVIVTREYAKGPQTIHFWDSDAFANFQSYGIKPKASLDRSYLPRAQKKLWDEFCGTGDKILNTWYGGYGNEWEFLKGPDQQLDGNNDEDQDEERVDEGRCAEATWKFIARVRSSITETSTWTIDPQKERMKLMGPNYDDRTRGKRSKKD